MEKLIQFKIYNKLNYNFLRYLCQHLIIEINLILISKLKLYVKVISLI